jgi:hypothetical protein
MWIMAGQTVCGPKWLALVRLAECRILGIMAVNAQRWGIFGQVEIKFAFATLAHLVSNVAGIAAHIQSCVSAAILRNIDADLVATQAKIRILRVSASGLKQLILIV